ncbi:MAG: rhomboid family intramembrane serine protease [Candidatus Aminicenantes bacterium]|nr:rhomboid family intramembrane serine protease [Candidatus Aminicenantes bacterium]
MFFPIKDYNPTRGIAYVTILLIIINTGVFLYQAVLSEKPLKIFIFESAMVPYEIAHQQNVTLPMGSDPQGGMYVLLREIPPNLSILTSIFMHGSFWHLFGNMLFLWIFGKNIEDRLGKVKFILFYLLCGVGASLTHVLFHHNSLSPVLGASGAVSGVMGAYLILFPLARIRTLVFIFILVTFVDLPAYLFLIIWFVFQLMYTGQGSGVAWIAHVGGFIIGIILIKWMRNKQKPIIEFIP